jgi:hypothetical protein
LEDESGSEERKGVVMQISYFMLAVNGVGVLDRYRRVRRKRNRRDAGVKGILK